MSEKVTHSFHIWKWWVLLPKGLVSSCVLNACSCDDLGLVGGVPGCLLLGTVWTLCSHCTFCCPDHLPDSEDGKLPVCHDPPGSHPRFGPSLRTATADIPKPVSAGLLWAVMMCQLYLGDKALIYLVTGLGSCPSSHQLSFLEIRGIPYV